MRMKVFFLALLLVGWSAQIASAGSIVRRFDDGITGTVISNLTQNAIFPDGSTGQETLTQFFEGITGSMNLAQKGLYKDLQYIPPGQSWQESFWIKPSGFWGKCKCRHFFCQVLAIHGGLKKYVVQYLKMIKTRAHSTN